MKKIFLVVFILLIIFNTYGQNADLVYVDGWVDIKSGGEIFEAFPGDSLRAGDSVITGSDSIAELEQSDLSTIIVQADSIFTIREIETDFGKETVLATTVGAVSFKFGKLFGKEPVIATPSMVAGIRGTELTVYAGEDGSTLIAVESGLVTVESHGVSVDLTKDEGVEVLPGEVPGEKFSLLGRELDFSSWNAGKYEALIADPVAGLVRLGRQINDFIGKIDGLEIAREENIAAQAVFQAEMEKIEETDGHEKAQVFLKENIQPLILVAGPMLLNIRYHTLSALSFRRYILGRLYLDMKSRYIMDTSNQEYMDFLTVYEGILNEFEIYIVPYMSDRDL